MRLLQIIVLFFLIIDSSFSQSDSVDLDLNNKKDFNSNNYLLIRSHAGFLIAHRTNMLHIPRNHVFGMELNYEQSLSLSKNWHHLYPGSKYGFGFYVADVGNKEILGTGYALFSYLKANLIKSVKRWAPRLKLGYGIGYLTKPFDADQNHKNNAIGSHFNLFVNTQFDLSYYFKNWQAGIGLAFSHFSNASFRLPNLGINVPSINFTLGYQLSQIKLSEKVSDLAIEKKWHFDSFLASGVKEIQTNKHRLYPSFDLLVRARKNFNNKTGFGFGTDLMWSTSLRERMVLLNYENAQELSIFQWGINIIYYQQFDDLSLFVTKGIYAISDFKDDGFFYHRFGASYCFSNNILLYAALKSHWAKADHFEIGLGYRFR